jgi:glutaminase
MSCRIDASFIQDAINKMRSSAWQAEQYGKVRQQLEECLMLLKTCGVDSAAKELVELFIQIAEEGRRHHSRLAQLLEELAEIKP